MAQDDYDQGYDDGRRSRDSEVEALTEYLNQARADLASERANAAYYRKITLSSASGKDNIPF